MWKALMIRTLVILKKNIQASGRYLFFLLTMIQKIFVQKKKDIFNF